MKNFFKKKSTIAALVFIFAGIIALVVMSFIPHGVKYKTQSNVTYGDAMNGDYIKIVEFIGDGKMKTYRQYESGKIDQVQIYNYEIKDGILYQNGIKFGEIDVYEIRTSSIHINGKKQYFGYECMAAKITKYVSYGFMVIGVFILIKPIFIKKKEKSTN